MPKIIKNTSTPAKPGIAPEASGENLQSWGRAVSSELRGEPHPPPQFLRQAERAQPDCF